MKKWVGWICFFLIVVGLAVGGFFLAASFDRDTFEFKEVEILDYDDYSLNDFVYQDIVCKKGKCNFKDKDVIFNISDVKELGPQDITLKLEYEGEVFEKTFHVDVVDKKKPEIILNETFVILDLNEKLDAASYISEVKDNYDTLDILDVKIENDVDLKNPGDYEIVYTISDSSGNVGEAILKVKVKGEREVISSNNDLNNHQKEEVKEQVTLTYSVSSLFNDSGEILQEQELSLMTKDIELGWDTTFKVTASISSSGKVGIIISKNEITGNELTGFNGALPQARSKEVKANDEASFEYTFSEEGTYYVSVVGWDEDNQVIVKKDFCLNLTKSDEVKDMKILTEDHSSYLTIDATYIGGPDSLYFDAAISKSNDPNIEEAFVYEDDEIRLYYTSGCYYEILGAIFDESGKMLLAKTITIQK